LISQDTHKDTHKFVGPIFLSFMKYERISG